MKKHFYWILLSSFTIWLAISMYSQGSAAAALILYKSCNEAWSASLKAAFQTYLAIVAISRSLYLWAVVFAPFISDLAIFWRNHGLPIAKKLSEIALPHILDFSQFTYNYFRNCSFEISASFFWIPICFFFSRIFGRQYLRGMVLPLVWFSWRFFPAGSRVLSFSSTILFPVVLSLLRFRRNEKILPLICYWLIFPFSFALDNFLSNFSIHGIYTSTASALIPWAILSGDIVGILDTLESSAASQAITSTLSQALNRKSRRNLIFSITPLLMRKLNDIKNSNYALAIFAFLVIALIYSAFSFLQKILTILVWPWFFLEVGRVCVSRSESLYRQNLSFSLLFIFLEFLIIPIPILGFFHLPMVFGLKLGSEILLDALLNFGNKLKNS